MYVLEDDLERELDLPRGDYDVPIVIADHAFNRDGSFRYARTSTSASAATRSSSTAPSRRGCASSGGKYRFRFLNASNAPLVQPAARRAAA